MKGQDLPTFLSNPQLKCLLFGGKGGVGKTTVAAATAMYLANRSSERRILLVSTDPAHSLSDSFEQPIGDTITSIEGLPNLSALEMDAPRRQREFQAKYGEELEALCYRGTILDREDLHQLFSLSMLGIDEMMAIIEIADIIERGEYDSVILDTAPTGHTIKLLELPDHMRQWLNVLELMQRRYRYIVARLVHRGPKEDKVDAFLAKQLRDINRVRSLLTAKTATEFVPVMIPEEMVVEETHRLVNALQRLQVPIRTIVVNRVVTNAECPFCESRLRAQKEPCAEIERRFSSYELVRVALLPWEVRGQERLRGFAQAMIGEKVLALPPSKPTTMLSSQKGDWHWLHQTELILFGGKGGVGKTTVAATTALHLSRLMEEKKILLFSTDPAHSLSDVFHQRIGDRVTPILGVKGLFALEIDAPRLLEEFKDQFREDIDELLDSALGSGVDAPFDRAIMEELINAVPPGADELIALMKIIDFMEEQEFDRYILDMAPTGHALRFLELPDIVAEWLKTALRLIVKYARGRAGDITIELLQRSRGLRLVTNLLRNPQRCQFVCITIPEAMAVVEAQRLVERLTGLGISCSEMVVNMVVPATHCRFCAAKRWEQQRHLEELDRLGLAITHVPLFPQEITGLQGLGRVAETIFDPMNGRMNERPREWAECSTGQKEVQSGKAQEGA